jgi:hypothetical protein
MNCDSAPALIVLAQAVHIGLLSFSRQPFADSNNGSTMT